MGRASRRMAACTVVASILRDAAQERGSSESDSKQAFDISCSCQTAGEQTDARNQYPGLGAGNGCLEVFGEPSIAAEPGKRTLDDPTPWLGFEGAHALGASNDLNRPLAQIGDLTEQFRSSIDTVGEDVAQLGEHSSDGSQFASVWRRSRCVRQNKQAVIGEGCIPGSIDIETADCGKKRPHPRA